jgi:hypothetical protein
MQVRGDIGYNVRAKRLTVIHGSTRCHLRVDQVEKWGGATDPAGQPHGFRQPAQVVGIVEEIVVDARSDLRIAACEAQQAGRLRQRQRPRPERSRRRYGIYTRITQVTENFPARPAFSRCSVICVLCKLGHIGAPS